MSVDSELLNDRYFEQFKMLGDFCIQVIQFQTCFVRLITTIEKRLLWFGTIKKNLKSQQNLYRDQAGFSGVQKAIHVCSVSFSLDQPPLIKARVI